ncbi:HlyD family secretion protein [Lewinella sp. W8]|uniref:HlyD family secretion protein n=1 Tax=Lewinella sp. W8 TaxID=2528208 RepID=UPI001068953C|nr:HlyD family efflux transporter periplasmic adaptor subunit [Lewinella sp. W8]MTB50704.1 HlyD family efflux transporter periplasmic adaptor subunit [Lewinella sp. W8]
MSKNLPKGPFPFPLVTDNVEALYARHHLRGRSIYLFTIAAVLLALAALPVISVDVSSQARGVLRPAIQHTPLLTASGGQVLLSRLEENRSVRRGDTLLVVDTGALEEEREYLQQERADRHQLMRDLRELLAALETERFPQLLTALYQRDYQRFREQLDAAALKVQHAERQLKRQQTLMESGSIARMDLEQTQFEYDLVTSEHQQIRDQRRHLWTQELVRTEREAADLTAQLTALHLRARQFILTAPVDGDLMKVAGIQAGSQVTAGQELAVISPHGDLEVLLSVSPNDIGLISKGMPVQLRMDAFNHHHWGLGRATVMDIARDVSMQDGAPSFLVKARLEATELQLDNGYVGRLQKGMTFTANFILARRTLAQLLFDQMSDWFVAENPAS